MDSFRVKMGNDEFILFIRKNFPNCGLTSDVLGKRIWSWLSGNATASASQIEPDKPCYWGSQGSFISDIQLPKTAMQFEFNAVVLSELYRFLISIGRE